MLVECQECAASLAGSTAECSSCGAPSEVALGPSSACAECRAVFRPAYERCLECGAPKAVAMATTPPETTSDRRSDGQEWEHNASVPHSRSQHTSGGGHHSKSGTGDGAWERGESGLAVRAHESSRDELVNSIAIPKGEGQMTFWRWLYRRIGQMLSFAAATVLLLFSSTVYEPLPPIIGSAVLFGVALSLRQQMIRRFYVK